MEVLLGESSNSLREYSREYWDQLLECAGAKILSKISSTECDAYLLSESSLFVWDNQFTLITCGQTTLVDAAKFFLKEHKAESLQSFIYERKNEYFPKLQPTSFFEDAKELQNMIPGKALRFGPGHGHHLHLFHSNKSFNPDPEDTTLEFLMYDLDQKVSDRVKGGNLKQEDYRDILSLDKLFPDFDFDDYCFEPTGYSVNGLRDKYYFTIHITPHDIGFYISFETNLHLAEGYSTLLNKLIEVLRPKSFDVVVFHPEKFEDIEMAGFHRVSRCQDDLGCGYNVGFNHFAKIEESASEAVCLTSSLSKELNGDQ